MTIKEEYVESDHKILFPRGEGGREEGSDVGLERAQPAMDDDDERREERKERQKGTEYGKRASEREREKDAACTKRPKIEQGKRMLRK